MMNERKMVNAVKKMIKKAVTELPEDVTRRIKDALEREEHEPARIILSSIIKNINLAKEMSKPICQDTGVPIFYVEIGTRYKVSFNLERVLIKAMQESTSEIPLRPNSVDPLTNKNTGDNTGRFIPYINYEVIEGDDLKITYFPKGAGSENQSQLFMLNPSEGFNQIEDIIYDSVIKKAAQACPPIIIGVGLGGGADIALHLAKKALTRDINIPHSDEEIARLERRILKKVNESGLGPMGLGGKTTALSVKIEYAYRHPASFPMGVIFQCWAARKSRLTIKKNGDIIIF
ncbi:MAG: fumarate hydratase [Candidatus Odinarchaeia archaeon]